MKRLWKVCFFLFSALCLLCVSCATRTEYETVEVEVPVPMEINLTDIVNPVLQQRPDNGTLEIHPGPIFTLLETVENSATYMRAWQMWQAYADSLEKVLVEISEQLSVRE